MGLPALYVGAVSRHVVDAVIRVSNHSELELGIIASRNQCDYNRGYSGFTTMQLFEYVYKQSDYVHLCRDHAGPLEGEKDLGKKSLSYDCQYMDIIHIDPWKSVTTMDEGIDKTVELIKYCYKKNENAKFEVGTEESIFPYTPAQLRYILVELERKLTDEQFNNIIYAVIQSGMRLDVLGGKNIGTYNQSKSEEFIDTTLEFNIIPKEHNSDFLDDYTIGILFDDMLGAVNIAPEFGRIESQFIVKYMLENEYFRELESFYRLCLEQGKWKRWILDGKTIEEYSKTDLCESMGHYTFETKEFLEIKKRIGIDPYDIITHISDHISDYIEKIYNPGGGIET